MPRSQSRQVHAVIEHCPLNLDRGLLPQVGEELDRGVVAMTARSILALLSIAFCIALIFAVVTTLKYAPPTHPAHAALTQPEGGQQRQPV